MGTSISTSDVVFSTNLTSNPKDFEPLKRKLQSMQSSMEIDLHPTLEFLQNRQPEDGINPNVGGYIPPTEHFIFISVLYELLNSNPSILDLIQFTAKQLITKVLSSEGGINFGDIHVELKLSFLNNININIGKEIVISKSTPKDQAIVVLQDEFKRLKKEVEDLKKQNDED